MNDNENLKSLYNTLQKEGYTPPAFEQFAKDMEDDGNLRGVYSTLQNEGYTPPDYDTFRNDMGFGKVAKTNPKVKVGSHAQMVVDEYDRAAKAAGAELTGNNEKLNGEARNEANEPNRTDKPNKANGPDTPRMQFVPEAENVVMATPTAETLKKYPWLKADEAVPFDRNTGEPLHTWVDEQGNPISQRDLDVRRAKEEITGEKEYMQKTPASLQLPVGTTRGVRLDGSISGYVDNMMKQQYGDDYLNGQYTTEDGRQLSGAEYLNEKAQETYDQLNKEMDEARMSYIGADEEKRKEFVDALANKYDGLLTRDTIQRAMDDEQAQEEAKATKRERERAQLDTAYDTAYARRAEAMNENMRKAQEEYENSSWLDRMFGGNPVQRAYWANQNDRRIQIADTQMNIVLDARKIIDAGEAYGKGETWAGRLVRGMGDALTDTGLYDSGVEDMHDLRNVKNALDAYEAGTATKEQKELLDVYALLHTAQGENADAMGGWYGAGGTTVQALPFMAQMAINPASNLGSATMKAATKWGVKQFGKTAMNKYLKRMFVTSLKAGGRVTGDALAAVLPAFTFGSPAITADTYDRLIGNVHGTEDEAGNIIYKNRSDFETSKGAAIAKAVGANLLEYQSEMAGPYFGALSKIAKTGTLKGLEKIGLEKTRDFLTRFSNKDFYRAYASFARKTQWHGTFEEYLEEVYNNVANAIFIGDMDFSTGDNGVFNLEMNLDTLLGVAVMSGAMSTLKTVDYARTRGRIKDELDEAYKSGLDIFGTDEWERITDRIDGLDDDKAASEIRKIISGVDGKERKHAVVNYAAASFMNQGLNMGELKNSLEQISDAAVNGGVPKDAIPGIENLTPEEQQNVHEDGMIHTALLYPTAENGGEPQEVFITKGNVVMRGDGTIDTEASSDAIYYKGSDGQVHMTSPDKIQSVNEPISVEEYAAAGEMNEPNMPNEPNTTEGFAVGDEVNVNIDDEQAAGEITGMTEDGLLIVSYETPDGTMSSIRISPDELRNMNRPNDEQPPMGGAGAVIEEPTGQNGNIEQQNIGSADLSIPENGNIGAENISTEEESAESIESAGSAGNDEEEVIPKDEDGNPRYHDAPVEATIADLYDGSLDDTEVQGFIDANINEAQKRYDNIQKKAPKIGTNKAKYLEQKRKWQTDVDEAKRVLDYWNEVNAQKESITHTTPQEIEAAQAELSGQNAREEYAAMNENVPTNSVAVASDFIRGAKITPESFRAETGYGTGEQRRFVGMIATEQNGGKSIDRLAEELVSYDNAELNGVTFNGDTGAAKDAILEALHGAGTRGELTVDNTAEQERYVEARRAELDAQYMEAYGMTYEDYLAYEEQNLPEMLRKYANFDEVEFYNLYADEIEQSLNARINEQGNDTTGEEPRAGGGDEVLPGEGTDNARGSEGGTEQGTEVPAGVQGRVEEGTVREAAGRNGISSDERGGQINIGDIAGRQQDDLETSEEVRLSDEIDENGRQFVLTSNGRLEFGKIDENTGLTPAPILLSEGIITNPATNDGYGLVHIEARHGDQIRKAGYKSVIDFIEEVAKNYERIKEGNVRNGNQTYMLQLKDKHNNTLMVELSSDGNYWNINTAGIFKETYGKNRKEVYSRHTTAKQSAETVVASQEVAQSGTSTSSSMNATTSFQNGAALQTAASKPHGDNINSSIDKDTQISSNEQTIGEKIEDKPFSIVESRRGTVSLYRGKHTKGGITYTRVVAMRNGGRVSMPTAFMPFPESMEAIDIPEGVSVLGVKELREDGKGKSEATVVVRYEDGALGVIESKLQPSEKKGLAERIATAEAETDTEPTEAQKEAGNYKKGHVKIDGFDVTIENPKGSVRSGKDADGTPWSVTMNNTYGYIRGTEGVDGDHIDVYLSDNPTEGNVFVIDQVNSDGSFDEHKVMYGFNSAEEARDAYLANYSPGWQGLGTITEVTKDEFKKWVNSSHRKTKPFAEYKSVNKANGTNETNTPRPKKGESAVEYTRRLAEVKINNEKILADEAHEAFSEIMSKSSHNVEINNDEVSETDNTLYAPIRVDGRRTNLSLYQEEPAHSNEEPIIGVSYYREGLTYQEASDLSEEYNRHVGEDVCSDGNDELAVNFNSIDEAVRFEKWLKNRQNDGVRFRKADDEISDFAQKHKLNRADVEAYADYMGRENLNGAARAFHEIRRKVRLDNQGASLGQFTKIFPPIEKELYEKFGNIDDLRQQYVQRTLDERNAMEAARKRAEEAAEAEHRRLQEFQDMSDEQLDSEYMKAVEANNEGRMRDLVNEAARRKGYGDIQSDYQGVGAWAAPSNPGYESDEERREALQADGTDVNVTDIAEGYSSQPGDYFTNLRAYGNDTPHGKESAKAINDALEEIRKGNNPKIKVYRAVPKSVKEGRMRNGDWVTPSRKYAEMHGDNRLEGDYRIIEQEVPANELWWDGNDLNEWGFDDGKGYAYRNTKNNRKLNDLITRDDGGNIIPLSQRFNARKSDVRYNKDRKRSLSAEEAAIRDAVVDRLRESGLEVITDAEEGQRVLDEANGRGERVRTQAMLDGLTKAANTIRSWIKGNKRGRVFTIELPESTQRKIKEAMGRDFDSHNITANGIAHALKNHGVGGNKLNKNSIPLREEDAELIPYIMTAPDYVKKASTDVSGRESVRFYKELSNGYVVVVEKEYKNSPDDMETITMWAETSSEATNARQETVPDTHVQNAILSTDAAKIRKDAETAIENDGKIREHRDWKLEESGRQYEKAKEVLDALHKAGFKDFYISRSITDFGVSTYIQGQLGLKFRISDHSVTSTRRIWEEDFFDFTTPPDVLVSIAKERKKEIDKRNEIINEQVRAEQARRKAADEK